MADLPIQRLRRALARFCKEVDFDQLDMREVEPAIKTLDSALERVQVDNVSRLRGRSSLLQTGIQLRRHIYYMNKKVKQLEADLQRLRGDHNHFLTTFWTIQAGLSDPKTSYRSVGSWCQDIFAC